MKTKIVSLVAFLALLVAGCITYPNFLRVNASVDYCEYSPLMKSDLVVPLVIEVSGEALYVKLLSHPTKRTQVVVERRSAQAFVSALDKFLEWHALAEQRGDCLSKRIGGVSYNGFNYAIRFYTAAEGKHYLLIGVRSKILGDGPIEPDALDLSLDSANALRLRNVLMAFSENRLDISNKDGTYK